MSTAIVPLEERKQLEELARSLHATGAFGAEDAGHAYAKVLAGREYGLPPAVALTMFHVVQRRGRVAGIEPSAEYLAARVRDSGRYDYRVRRIDNEGCEIAFMSVPDGELLGVSEFTLDDARMAGLLERPASGNPGAWDHYPRNMCWARAMTNGVTWFCPDIVLPAGEIVGEGVAAGAVVDTGVSDDAAPSPSDDGEIVEGEIVEGGGPGEADHGEGRRPAPPDAPTDQPGAGDATAPAPGADRPKGPTRGMLAKLAVLAGRLGYDDTERHERAGVASFKELTRDEARELIALWEREVSALDARPDPTAGQDAPSAGDVAEGSEPTPGEAGGSDPDGPITQATVAEVLAMYGGSVAKARQTAQAFGKSSLGELTEDQGQQLLARLREMVAEATAQQELGA